MNDNDGNDRPWGRPLTPCGRTRREFFWEAAGGFVGTALATLLAEDGFFARSAAASEREPATASPLGPEGAPFSGQGQGVHRPVHVRRRQPGRYVRPQARADQAQRQADPDARQRPAAQGPQAGDAAGLVAQVRPARPGGDRRSPTCIRTWPGGWTTWRSSAACTPTASRTARACSR